MQKHVIEGNRQVVIRNQKMIKVQEDRIRSCTAELEAQKQLIQKHGKQVRTLQLVLQAQRREGEEHTKATQAAARGLEGPGSGLLGIRQGHREEAEAHKRLITGYQEEIRAQEQVLGVGAGHGQQDGTMETAWKRAQGQGCRMVVAQRKEQDGKEERQCRRRQVGLSADKPSNLGTRWLEV